MFPDYDGKRFEDSDSSLPGEGVDEEIDASGEDLVPEGEKKKRKRKHRKRQGKNKSKFEDLMEQGDHADGGYTTAPEESKSEPRVRVTRGRFTENFLEGLEFGEARWIEGAERPWNSDTERERVTLNAFGKGKAKAELSENDQSQSKTQGPGIVHEAPETSTSNFEANDYLAITIANLDGFERNYLEERAELERLCEDIKKKATASGAAIDPQDPLQHDRLLEHFNAIACKEKARLDSIALLKFEAEYNNEEKRWGLVAEGVSRAENEHARAIGHVHREPYPMSMLEALNCPAYCAQEVRNPQTRMNKSGKANTKTLPFDEAGAQIISIIEAAFTEFEAISAADSLGHNFVGSVPGCGTLLDEKVSPAVPGM